MVEGEVIRNTQIEENENEKWKIDYIETEIKNQIMGIVKLMVDEIVDENELVRFIETGLKKLWISIKELETETEIIKRKKGLEMKWIRIRLMLYTTKQFELVISFFVIGTKRVFWIKDYTYTLYI
jgi:Cft2 family RNA processing exonuclease